MAERRLYAQFSPEKVNPDSEELQEWINVFNICKREGWGPAATQLTIDYIRDANAVSNVILKPFAVNGGGRMLGVSLLTLPKESKPGSTAFGFAFVQRRAQGYGIGMCLIDHLEMQATMAGCAALYTSSSARKYRDDRATRILRRAGFKTQQVLLRHDLEAISARRRLHLPMPPDIEIRVFEHPNDGTDMEAYAALFREAKMSLGFPDVTYITAQHLTKHLPVPFRSKNRVHAVYAIDTQTQAIVGTALAESNSSDTVTEVDWNYITPEYRGRSIGSHMLNALARRVWEASPQLERLRLFTPADDTTTISEARATGFAEIGYYQDWHKMLSPATRSKVPEIPATRPSGLR